MKMTNESMVTFQNGSDVMTESFRNQIYQLLEQSKVVHPIKDKDRRKKVAMTKDLQQLLSKNEKRVKEDEKGEDDLLQGKFKHFTGCLTTDGKDVETENKRKSIKEIVSDLVESLSFHQMNMKQISSDYYLYDRMDFLKRYYDLDREVDTYWIDIESLANMIIQIHKYSHIILSDEEGKDIWTNKVIYEKEKNEL